MPPRSRARRAGSPKKGISGVWLILGGGAIVGIILFAVLAFLVVKNVPKGSDARARVECTAHLANLGKLIISQHAFGGLKHESGSAFLLQNAEQCDDGSLGVMICRGDPRYASFGVGTPAFIAKYRSDWRTAPCSYRGPDAERFREAFRQAAGEPVIIACDRNGPDGKTPHHPDGVSVLWSNGKVEFIKWEKMKGYARGPVQVGPDSPDPRFHHLIP